MENGFKVLRVLDGLIMTSHLPEVNKMEQEHAVQSVVGGTVCLGHSLLHKCIFRCGGSLWCLFKIWPPSSEHVARPRGRFGTGVSLGRAQSPWLIKHNTMTATVLRRKQGWGLQLSEWDWCTQAC